MKIHNSLFIVLFLFISFNSLSQIVSGANKSYKVISIDSTENSYIIFISSNLQNTLPDENIPFLSKDNECNYYSIHQHNNTNQYCLVSPKIKDLNKNICIGCIYSLSLNCYTIGMANSAYVHTGYGDYILQHPQDSLWTANEVAGLSYTGNIDTINYYSSMLQSRELFDSKMLYIWMNLNVQSDICYSQWLNEQIKQIKPICLSFDKGIIILYQDECCNIPYTIIKHEDYYQDGTFEANLIFKYQNSCFIQIKRRKDIYGWIKNVNYNNTEEVKIKVFPFLPTGVVATKKDPNVNASGAGGIIYTYFYNLPTHVNVPRR